MLSLSFTHSLKSFTLLLEDLAPDETHSVSLAKSLVPCLIMRGAQLAVVRKLEGQHVIAIHTQLLGWIAKRLGVYESNKNQNKKETAILFFKVLQPLLAPLDNRDALAMYILANDLRDVADSSSFSSKAYLEQVLAQAKVKVSATSSTWEPQRAYERRLSNIMSKTKGILHKSPILYVLTPVSGAGSKPRGRAANKPRGVATSDEESGEQSGEEAPRQDPATQPPRPRPAYRTRRRSAEVDAMSASEDGGEDRSEGEAAPSPAAGKKRSVSARARQSKSRSVSRSKRPRARSSASEGARSGRSSPEGEVTPKASRKRARAARHEKEGGVSAEGAEDEGVTQGVEDILNEERTASSLSPARPASRASSSGAPEDKFEVRRKRVRL